MKQKITFISLLRRLLLVFSVVIFFAVLVACSDKSKNSSPPLTLSDIYATDVNVVYDGRPHSIKVNNTLPTDTVLYSTDGIVYSEISPAFVLPDTYTVFFKVIRSGYTDFSSSATITIKPSVLDGVSAPAVNVIYDGLSHTVSVNGTLTTDKITYSTDGFTFSSDIPSFTEIGVYTVYYRVERIYGEYKSSCTITILPNIFGRYFNPSFGLVILSTDCAYVNSGKHTITVNLDGSGLIGAEPFFVSDNCLMYNALPFAPLSTDQYVYKLSSTDNSVYFCHSYDGVLNISFDDNIGNITLEGQTLLSVPNVNYCESATVTSYAELTFEQAFSHYTDITEIDVCFSLRDNNPFTAEDLYFTYDGLPHGFEFSVPVVYPDDITPMFTEIGKHTVTVLFLSEEYLPLFLDCSIVILPNINGAYFSSERVFKFEGKSVYIDGKYSGELTVLDDGWAYDGLSITATDNGIIYDGVEYMLARPVLIVCVNDQTIARIAVPTTTKQVDITIEDGTLKFTRDNELLLTVPLTDDSVSLTCNGKPLLPIPSDTDGYFILGTAELNTDIILINIQTA